MTCTSCGNNLESFNRFCPKCGAPSPAQPAPSYSSPPPYTPPQVPHSPMMGGPLGQPPKKSGCGKIILILAIILLLLGGGIAAAIYFGYQKLESTLKTSEAYTVALNRLRENEDARNELGEIKETGFPLGAYDEKADGSGGAAFVMSVQGTKASGRYEVTLVRSNSVWQLIKGTLHTNGKVIDVAAELGSGDDDSDTNFNLNENTNLALPTPRNLKEGQTISGGVLNGKATSLPKPPYPPAAKAVKASGTVVVQVLLDEKGSVVTATAVSGHPLLRHAAVAAARGAKFSPTLLSGKPVKVSGVITYNFVAE